MAEIIAPEYARFVEAERRGKRLPTIASAVTEGEVVAPVVIEAGRTTELLRVAARRAAGFVRPTSRVEVVWVEGESELAVGIAGVDVELDDGLIRLLLPVRCDQAGAADVTVLFTVGSPAVPLGLYAATSKRPRGPEIVVSSWGDALVAFAWRCVLELVAGVAGAVGKDARGNVLVPVELAVSRRGIEILPMARHRFAGSSTLKGSVSR